MKTRVSKFDSKLNLKWRALIESENLSQKTNKHLIRFQRNLQKRNPKALKDYTRLSLTQLLHIPAEFGSNSNQSHLSKLLLESYSACLTKVRAKLLEGIDLSFQLKPENI